MFASFGGWKYSTVEIFDRGFFVLFLFSECQSLNLKNNCLRTQPKNKLKIPLCLICFLVVAASSIGQEPAGLGELLKDYENQRVLAAIDRGLNWLKLQQGVNGLFRDHPRMTALVISAFLKHPTGKSSGGTEYSDETPFLKKAITSLLEFSNQEGSIYDEEKLPRSPCSDTSFAIMALGLVKQKTKGENQRGEYQKYINKARNYIKDLQNKVNENDKYYGGIGYGSRETVNDLLNLSFALQAIRESESKESYKDDTIIWDRALTFVSRCQNLSDKNDREQWVSNGPNDGGFVYAPSGESKANKKAPTSYASMTYTGLLCLLLCESFDKYDEIDRYDIRITRAFDWISQNYSLEGNHGMKGRQAKHDLYYTYYMMAKTLSLFGEDTISDSRGNEHKWYRELSAHLMQEQVVEDASNEQLVVGYWKNSEGGWRERDTLVTTCYAILALEEGFPKQK